MSRPLIQIQKIGNGIVSSTAITVWRDENPGVILSLHAEDLSQVDLRGANLRGAVLSSTNLTGADLTGANLSGANLFDANLTGAQMNQPVSMLATCRGLEDAWGLPPGLYADTIAAGYKPARDN